MIGWIAMSVALGTPCDGPALERALARASTLAVPAAYEALAACDPARARRLAGRTLERMYGDDGEHGAVAAMVDVGAGAEVASWLAARVPPDDRLAILRTLGEGCAARPTREAFFTALREDLGDDFYVDRWHRGLGRCRTPAGRALLSEALESDTFGIGSLDRGAFLDILEVYVRNLRGEALPLIERYARELTDDEEIAYVIQLLPRAVGYDAPEGIDRDEAAAAGALLLDLGAELDADLVDLARATLRKIGEEEAADRMVRHRWPDAWRVGGGRYHYAAVAAAEWTCRPGRRRAVVAAGTFAEDGRSWPDAVAARAPDRLVEAWGLLDDPPCDGVPEIAVAVSEKPLKTEADRQAWIEAHLAPWMERVRGRKVVRIDGEPFVF